MDDQQHPSPVPSLPFPWSAVRYSDPHTKEQGRHNVVHLRMDGAFTLGRWSKPAEYILCASPVTTRSPQYWQPVDEMVTCEGCLARVEWFLARFATQQQQKRRDQ